MDEKLQNAVRALAAGESLPRRDDIIGALDTLGLEWSVSGERVELRSDVELLEGDRLERALAPFVREALTRVDILWSVDSTNTWLLDRSGGPGFNRRVCLAEQQVAGKGRRGRYWISPFGKNIYLSLGWELPRRGGAVGGLSLAVGMAVVTALGEAGVTNTGLKWPNDVLVEGRKLAGILVEMAPAAPDRYPVVVGVGVNMRLDVRDADRIDQSFSTTAEQSDVSRNELVARLLESLVVTLEAFERSGFSVFADRWPDFDVYFGREVCVTVADEPVTGVDRGVDEGGNLLLETAAGVRTFNAGEVSLRPLATVK